MYPYFFNNLNFNNIFFTGSKNINNNIKIIFIKYNDKNKIKNCVFQLPTLINNHTIDNNNFEINLKCNNKNKTQKLIDFFNNLDNKIIFESKKNINWFNDINDKSNIKYKKIIKDTHTCEHGCINFKLNNYSDFTTKILLNNIIYNDILPHDGNCQIVLECYGIIINNINSEFELLLRPIILSFKLNYNYILLDSDCDDNINNETDKINNTNKIFNKESNNTSKNNTSKNKSPDNKINNTLKNKTSKNNSSDNKISHNTSDNNTSDNTPTNESNNNKLTNKILNNKKLHYSESDNDESDNNASDNDESDNDESVYSESVYSESITNVLVNGNQPEYINFKDDELLFIKSSLY